MIARFAGGLQLALHRSISVELVHLSRLQRHDAAGAGGHGGDAAVPAGALREPIEHPRRGPDDAGGDRRRAGPDGAAAGRAAARGDFYRGRNGVGQPRDSGAWRGRNAARGRHLITAATEHHAVLRAFEYLERHEGFRVTCLPVDAEGRHRPGTAAGARSRRRRRWRRS